MLNVIAIICIVSLFACYEILLALGQLFVPGRAFYIAESLYKDAVRNIFSLLRAYCDGTVEVENLSGKELPQRFVLVTNHQSLIDIPVCIAAFPGSCLRFVSKRELGMGIPFVSSILRSQGHALIRRKGDASQAMRTIRRFALRCEREGTCPVIFPEGTRSRDAEVHEFHTAGVRKILDETPLHIVVAVVDGGWRIAKGKDLVTHLRGIRFRLRVLSVSEKPLSGKREVLEALSKAREDIVAGLATLRTGD
jgi:1-acyl-sn-glycerol-3-phosphate acyltransferase